MQKIIQCNKKNFWSNQVDINEVNEKIARLNKDGWVVKSMTTNTSFGSIFSYSLLMEQEDND